jgi:ABC-type amino acid transport substrate-binding protein
VTVILLSFCSFNLFALQVVENKETTPLSIYSDELNDLLERKVLRVAMYKGNTWPFYFQEEIKGVKSELKGIDVEIIKGFARQLGLKVEFIRSETIDGVVDLVEEGKVDLAISKLSITFSRASRVLFTKPYIKLRKGLLVNRVGLQRLQQRLGNLNKNETIQVLAGNADVMTNSSFWQGLGFSKKPEDVTVENVMLAFNKFKNMEINEFLPWRAIGVMKNSSYVGFSHQRFKHMEIIERSSWQDVVNDVSSGEVIAGFRDEAEIKKAIFLNKSLNVDLLTVVLENDFDPKGIALPSNAIFLKSLLDFYIDSLGLELTANSVVFEYDSVIAHLNRYNNKDIETE